MSKYSHYSQRGFKLLIISAILSIVSFSVDVLGSSVGMDQWHLRNPGRMPYQLWSVCYGSNCFVAGGNAGTLLSSSDGINWQPRHFNATNIVGAVTYANNHFMAILNTMDLMTSPDGIAWERWGMDVAEPLTKVVYGNGMYWGMGWSGNLYASVDERAWVLIRKLMADRDIIFADGKFVWLGYDAIYTSTNGTNWSFTYGSPCGLRAITYGNRQFIVVGESSSVVVSYDGFSWGLQNTGVSMPSEITFGNGQFIAAGYGKITISTNGTNWYSRSLPVRPSESYAITGVAAGNGRFVAVCESSKVLVSANSIDWGSYDSGWATARLGGITHGNGVFLTGGGFMSQDGMTWNYSPCKGPSANMIFAAGVFVGVGPGIWASLDGVNWTNSVVRQLTGIEDVAYGNGRFLAVGDETFISTNGLDWLNCSNRTTGCALTFGGGVFAAINGRQIQTSSNGITWASHPIAAVHQLNDIAYGNGAFICVGELGSMFVSSNAVDWIQQDPTIFHYQSLLAIIYEKGMFVTVGRTGGIYTSTDGVAWKQRESGTALDLYNLCHGNNSFVVTGQNGLVLQSDPLVQLSVSRDTGNPVVGLNAICDTGEGCWLESSPDLHAWQAIGTNKIQGPIVGLEIPANTLHQYYRLNTSDQLPAGK